MWRRNIALFDTLSTSDSSSNREEFENSNLKISNSREYISHAEPEKIDWQKLSVGRVSPVHVLKRAPVFLYIKQFDGMDDNVVLDHQDCYTEEESECYSFPNFKDTQKFKDAHNFEDFLKRQRKLQEVYNMENDAMWKEMENNFKFTQNTGNNSNYYIPEEVNLNNHVQMIPKKNKQNLNEAWNYDLHGAVGVQTTSDEISFDNEIQNNNCESARNDENLQTNDDCFSIPPGTGFNFCNQIKKKTKGATITEIESEEDLEEAFKNLVKSNSDNFHNDGDFSKNNNVSFECDLDEYQETQNIENNQDELFYDKENSSDSDEHGNILESTREDETPKSNDNSFYIATDDDLDFISQRIQAKEEQINLEKGVIIKEIDSDGNLDAFEYLGIVENDCGEDMNVSDDADCDNKESENSKNTTLVGNCDLNDDGFDYQNYGNIWDSLRDMDQKKSDDGFFYIPAGADMGSYMQMIQKKAASINRATGTNEIITNASSTNEENDIVGNFGKGEKDTVFVETQKSLEKNDICELILDDENPKNGDYEQAGANLNFNTQIFQKEKNEIKLDVPGAIKKEINIDGNSENKFQYPNKELNQTIDSIEDKNLCEFDADRQNSQKLPNNEQNQDISNQNDICDLWDNENFKMGKLDLGIIVEMLEVHESLMKSQNKATITEIETERNLEDEIQNLDVLEKNDPKNDEKLGAVSKNIGSNFQNDCVEYENYGNIWDSLREQEKKKRDDKSYYLPAGTDLGSHMQMIHKQNKYKAKQTN